MPNVNIEIRKARIKKGILIREMAAKLQMDPSVLSKLERGERPFSKEIISKLCSPDYLGRKDLLVMWYENQLEQIIGTSTEGRTALLNLACKK